MIRALIVSVSLLTAGFADVNTCDVQGKVYATVDELDFTRADTCQGVRDRIQDGALHLDGARYWVVIVVPRELREPGWRPLRYHWGKAVAHVGPHVIPVAYGPVGKG